MNNLGEFRAEVEVWIDRQDIGERFVTAVRMVEAEIYRNLRCRENEFIAVYSEAAGSAAGEHLLLPPNFKEIRYVTWNGAPLDIVSVREALLRRDTSTDTEPECFALDNQQLLLSAEIDDDPANWSGGLLEVGYYGTESLVGMATWHTPQNPVEDPDEEATDSITDLSDDNTTRMLLAHPDIYLDGVMYRLYKLLREPKKAVEYRSDFRGSLKELRAESKRSKSAGGNPQVKSAYGD